MLKLKLLLLGGIFTLFGIFNFSNAESITINGNNSSKTYSPSTITIPQGDFEGISNKTCNEGDCMIFITEGPATDEGDDACYVFGYGEIFGGEIEVVPYSCQAGQTYYVNIPYAFVYDNNAFENITLKFEDTNTGGGTDSEGGQIILGGFDNFTPAIDGLHSTVNQLIPLVVYLGFGVLLVILGFIAIRWLVNWMFNGIKSKFSSKRG